MKYCFIISLLLFSLRSGAQTTANVDISFTLPSVALLDLLPNGSSNISLNIAAPTEAGRPPVIGSSVATNWLILSSAVTSIGSRRIEGIVVGTLPTGVRIRVDVSPYAGTGAGLNSITGYVTGNVFLSTIAVTFIQNIKGAYSGTGYGSNGYKLTYSLDIQNYASLRSEVKTVTVRYTMIDN